MDEKKIGEALADHLCENLEKLSPQPGDILLLTIPDRMAPNDMDRHISNLRKVLTLYKLDLPLFVTNDSGARLTKVPISYERLEACERVIQELTTRIENLEPMDEESF